MDEPKQANDASLDNEPQAASTSWPPPPNIAPPTLQGPIVPAYAPLGQLSRAIIILLTAHAALSALRLMAELLAPAAFQKINSVVVVIQPLLILPTGICFLVWTYRLDQNLWAFGATMLKFTPGWAAGYFFVPVINLYQPYQIFREIWQASDAGPAPRAGRTWRTIRPPALLGLWWGCWILSNVLDSLSAQTPNDHSASAADGAFRLVAAALAIAVVRTFTARQNETAKILSIAS